MRVSQLQLGNTMRARLLSMAVGFHAATAEAMPHTALPLLSPRDVPAFTVATAPTMPLPARALTASVTADATNARAPFNQSVVAKTDPPTVLHAGLDDSSPWGLIAGLLGLGLPFLLYGRGNDAIRFQTIEEKYTRCTKGIKKKIINGDKLTKSELREFETAHNAYITELQSGTKAKVTELLKQDALTTFENILVYAKINME